jgi:hypothetical protein
VPFPLPGPPSTKITLGLLFETVKGVAARVAVDGPCTDRSHFTQAAQRLYYKFQVGVGIACTNASDTISTSR